MDKSLNHILKKLPYSEPFLFADSLVSVDENGIQGKYTFKADSYFYKGHFVGNPITPGVILTECMAQIGLVCLGIYLLGDSLQEELKIALSNTDIDFYLAVLPGETVTVISEKEYFRFNKLKCKVKMLNAKGEVVCKGFISGMLIA
ncbi:3-hydroxyacyl-ACP dehydratase FabZ family protein [Ulvibacter antarcticus]|uniref:3-hydroxyacyl-[acyl-carrier-protein] dehydratase n=1 Tax=Ulvibacter antarcticus TaxID=442714 RepID=A0A3L9ZCB8_9FLAO|nr:hydroxymyristoyl-ACP dehydratase [Ulvibacter antarcticus]RMA64272.1 3-hydroxyacyl-[acyl-carrier-protein] dehydratase [Ulvibacter antarcticus]